MTGISIETTLELWALSLRAVKARMAVLTVNSFAKTSRTMELEELEEDFERLSVSSAQRILWYWRDRIEVQSAVTDSAI